MAARGSQERLVNNCNILDKRELIQHLISKLGVGVFDLAGPYFSWLQLSPPGPQ